MIRRIQLKNFKCYGDPGVDFSLRRINFIFGDNSAGKSTFLQLLRMICNDEVAAIRANFKEYVFSGDTNLEIKLRITTSADSLGHSPKYEYSARQEGRESENGHSLKYIGYETPYSGAVHSFYERPTDVEERKRIHQSLKDPYVNGVPEMIHQEAARPIRTRIDETKKTSLDEALLLGTDAIKFVNEFFSELNVPYEALDFSRLKDKTFGITVVRDNTGAGIDGLYETGLSLCKWRAGQKHLFALEEPESHVNERQISSLMNFIFKTANENRDRQLIVESHSELMALKLKNFLRMGTITPDDLSVLYVTKTEEGSIVDEIKTDSYGNYRTRWPGGFFTARTRVVDEFFGIEGVR
ncbi:MAG: AAA family ATPase [Kiritimatiellae bacterium]|nr:AAA family ATPase [Kiritimatiellia bacterium]